MKVALVHDDLVQWGGAERMLVGLSEMFPQAPIFTSVFDKTNRDLAGNFRGKKIITSFLQRIPGWEMLYKTLLPFYPIAFEQFDFSGFDLVISQSTRFAKSIITKPDTMHISYCHTPVRFLWDDSLRMRLTGPVLSYFKRYDLVSAARVDHFVAGSENARQRIKNVYGVDSQVIYPFVDTDRFAHLEAFDGGYFLVIARLNEYKRVDLAVEACSRLNLPLKIVGTGPRIGFLKRLADNLNAETDFLGQLEDNLVGELLAGAKALIICAKEDFGITSLEAQVLGKPVVAFAAGGALESVVEGKSGFFFKDQTVESLTEVLKNADFSKIDPKFCKLNAKAFSKKKFMNKFGKQIDFLLK